MTCDLCGGESPGYTFDPGPNLIDLAWGSALDDTPWALCEECVQEIMLNTGPQEVADRAVANIHDPTGGAASAANFRIQIGRLFAALRAAYDRGASFR